MTVTALPTRRLIPTAHTSALAFAPAPAPAPAPAATTVSVTVDITLDAGAEAEGLLRLVRELVDRGAGSVTVTRSRPPTPTQTRAPASAPKQGWPRAPREAEESPLPGTVDPAIEVWIDAGARQVRVGDSEVALTRLEFDLLLFFARHPRRVFTRDHLLRSVWGYEMAGPRTVDVHIRRLRGKLGETLPLVTTVYGVGYRLADEAHVTVVGDAA